MGEGDFIQIEERLGGIISDAFEKSNSKKESLLTPTFIFKMGLLLIGGVLGYAGISNKVEYASANIIEMKQLQKDEKKESDIKREAMMIQIQTCQTQLIVLKAQVDDMKEIQDAKK